MNNDDDELPFTGDVFDRPLLSRPILNPPKPDIRKLKQWCVELTKIRALMHSYTWIADRTCRPMGLFVWCDLNPLSIEFINAKVRSIRQGPDEQLIVVTPLSVFTSLTIYDDLSAAIQAAAKDEIKGEAYYFETMHPGQQFQMITTIDCQIALWGVSLI